MHHDEIYLIDLWRLLLRQWRGFAIALLAVLALGPAGAVAAMLGLYAMLVWSARRLRASTSLFSLLIFLRMAYVAAMAPFAPQAYTFMSAGFIALCLLMQLFAAWLPLRRQPPFPMPRAHDHAA